MRETRWDSLEYRPPILPYDTKTNLLSDNPRLIGNSVNVYITKNGSISQRPGTTQYSSILTNKQIVRMWLYESMPDSTDVTYSYILMSVLNMASGTYELYYRPTGATPTTTLQAVSSLSSLRQCNASEKPHKVTFLEGKAYITSFPSAASGEKYGTVILDLRTFPYVFPWGIPGPAESATAAVRCARISGETIRLTAAVTATATTFNTTTNTPMPATPYDLWIGYEKVRVTAEPTSTSLTVTRGADGTTAEAHDANEVLIYRDWDASDHKVDVQYGWKYAFAYVSATGQISNRSDVEYNPDLMPSNTGPFYDLIPKIDLTLDSFFYNDTTTYPYLNMYRTTDGGGTFYFLEQVANPGTSTFTYEDDSFGTGASSTTYNDPVPDLKLDTARYAPSLTSNTPPITVVPPDVVGEDTPSKGCHAITTFASRIWKAIDNYLFFSSREETRDGNGAECFPSGNLGNFYIVDAAIAGLAVANNSLYVITTDSIYRITGSTIDTFSMTKLSSSFGGCILSDNCAISFGGRIAFVTSDGGVALLENDQTRIISRLPDIDLRIFPNTTLHYYRDNDYEWLIVATNTADQVGDESISLWYIYDLMLSEQLNTDFWFAPWGTKARACFVSNSGDTTLSGLFGADIITNTSTTGYSVLTIFNDSVATDVRILSNGTLSTFGMYRAIIFSPIRCPSGNHINTLNRPTKDISTYGFTLIFNGASSSHTAAADYVSYYKDNAYNLGGATLLTKEELPRITVSSIPAGYYGYFYPLWLEVYSIVPLISITNADTTTFLDLYSATFTFDPSAKP